MRYFLLLFSLVCTLGNAQEGPKLLRSDLQLEYVMEVSGKENVRILYDPVSKDLFYTSFEGEIYQVTMNEKGKWVDKKVFKAADHGITRLQGALFLDSTLFLAGNITVNDGYGTKGVLMRGDLTQEGGRNWTRMFITEDIGSTKTLYDHGFNGLAVSPDKQFIFVNSGARTDHGELQDNEGRYPGARDVPLTACILRIPIDAEQLVLENSYEYLTENGFLFADGIRNAYDLDFAPNGHFFAVSNSGDYDHPEDMFWLKEGAHYGFPWVMGNLENPQQYPEFEADHTKDPFLNPFGHAYRMKYFRNDPDFPKQPEGVQFMEPVFNLGPDEDSYRDKETGEVMDAGDTGYNMGTFTPHTAPLGLVFDTEMNLGGEYTGRGLMLNFSSGRRSFFSRDFPGSGEDLVMLNLVFNEQRDNYDVITTKLVESLMGPTDAVLIENELYILEYGSRSKKGKIWKVIFPENRNKKE